MDRPKDFALANRAFDLFTLAEREAALKVFAHLHYASIGDRFFEAVHRVICEKGGASGASGGSDTENFS